MNIHPANIAALDNDSTREVQSQLFLIGAMTGNIDPPLSDDEQAEIDAIMELLTPDPWGQAEADFDGPDEPYYSESELDYFADQAEDAHTRWMQGD